MDLELRRISRPALSWIEQRREVNLLNAQYVDQSEFIARRPLNGILDRIWIGGARPAPGGIRAKAAQHVRLSIQTLEQFNFKRREIKMKDMLLKMYVKAQILHEDYGQDLIEYALVVALIAFAATAGMSTVANKLNTAFGNIGNKVANYTT